MEMGKECRGRKAGEAAVVAAAAAAACFECNICLDFAAEPVVTLCGHLYCWPCVYRWLRSGREGSQQCPVCKAPISEDCLVPLYGRGIGTDAANVKGPEIPSRPSVLHDRARVASGAEHRDASRPMYDGPDRHHRRHGHGHDQRQYRHHYYAGTDYRSWAPVFHSTAGCVIGGMAVAMLPWAFQNNGAAALYHDGSDRVNAGDAGGRRPSRRQMQVVNSLHQIWFFLFVCMVVCLLLF